MCIGECGKRAAREEQNRACLPTMRARHRGVSEFVSEHVPSPTHTPQAIEALERKTTRKKGAANVYW